MTIVFYGGILFFDTFRNWGRGVRETGMSTIKDRTLMVLRSLSASTYIFTLCVITGTFLISAWFFKEPNSDYARSTTSVKKEMDRVSSSDLQLVFEVKSLSIDSKGCATKESEPLKEDSTELKSLVKEDTISESTESVSMSYTEYTDLCKLIEAEATSEDIIGRQMVANVVLNRVESPKFENSILDVIYEPGQFEPVSNHIIEKMVPSHETREAVFATVAGEDITGGALYFQKSADKIWGDKKYMYRYGGHSFYQ